MNCHVGAAEIRSLLSVSKEFAMHRVDRQKGAVILTVAMALLFLLGFMAIALDFGHLFVVKTELQTAMDSCALAAAQELDRASDALTRATNAGRTAGNLNKVNFQGAVAGVIDSEITFSDTLTGAYSHTFAPVKNAKYAKCTHAKSGMAPWLMQAISAFSGNASYKANQSVVALGVATLTNSQTACALPIAMCQKTATGPSFGYNKGDWVLGWVNPDDSVYGQFRWVDYTGNGGGAKEIKDMLAGDGYCALPGANTVIKSKTGNNNGASDAYNTRFGIYHGGYSGPADGTPDLTGYAWYSDDATGAGAFTGRYSDTGTNGFPAKRAAHAAYEGDNKKPPAGYTFKLQTQGTAVSSSTLAANGSNRRFAVAPVADCSLLDPTHDIKVKGLFCMLMLHPIDKSTGGGAGAAAKMWLEYEGSADDPTSPCSSSGLAGGSSGPLVPTLVQ
jgi:hypothetical protein